MPAPAEFRRRRLVVAAAAVLAVLLVVAVILAVVVVLAPASNSPRAALGRVAKPVPALASLSASTGSLAAGETLTLTGAHLSKVTRVTFGTVDAAVKVVDGSHLSVVVPPSPLFAAGTVPVTAYTGTKPVSTTVSYSYAATTPVDQQLSYAMQHWNSYNIAQYGNFNPSGGDCMNFASQTLIARGWKMTSEWYNHNGSASAAWINVPNMNFYLAAHPELGAKKLPLADRAQLKVGDLVMFDWNLDGRPDHIQVVSQVIHNADGTVAIKMVGHNTDSDYRDLDTTITVDHPGANAWFWSIPNA